MTKKGAAPSATDTDAVPADPGNKSGSRHIFDKETGQTFEQIRASLGTSAEAKRDDADQA